MKYSFFYYLFLYTVLAITVTWLMNRQIKSLNLEYKDEDDSEGNPSSKESFNRKRAQKNKPNNLNKTED